MELISVGITSLCTVIVAIIGAVTANAQKRNELYHQEERNARKLREEESRLSMQMMDATLQLSIVSANALTNGHNNGNVEAAREAAEKASAAYDAFLRRTTASAINSH